MICPKCHSNQIHIWYGGGKYRAQCGQCYWHGLKKSLKHDPAVIEELKKFYSIPLKNA